MGQPEAKLPKVSASPLVDGDRCSICLEGIGIEHVVTECAHRFCLQCVSSFLGRGTEHMLASEVVCPLCRHHLRRLQARGFSLQHGSTPDSPVTLKYRGFSLEGLRFKAAGEQTLHRVAARLFDAELGRIRLIYRGRVLAHDCDPAQLAVEEAAIKSSSPKSPEVMVVLSRGAPPQAVSESGCSIA